MDETQTTQTQQRDARRDPAALLMSLSYIAPVFSQLAMAGMMIAQGNWWFLGFIIPGILGSLASTGAALITMRRTRQEKQEAARALASAGTACGEESPAALTPPAPPLEELLFAGVKVARPQHAWRAVVHAWLGAGDAVGSLETPVGVCEGGVMRLDLLSSGPHALVAGTTGSGKSILLESWCLALACRFPPSRLRFVFLDFKGGAAFRVLRRLPHCMGCVTDLNLSHAIRALKALEGELRRREALVAAEGVATIGELRNPPPRLVIVVDEFAALRRQVPDYVERLITLASLGRSLGMNLVVCTQNPLGQVTAEMKANLNLNICLRVRDGLQSSELVGAPVAARISPREPGAAYMADGADVTFLRCARCGCPDALVEGCRRAARFAGLAAAPLLFSAPLPARVAREGLAGLGAGVPSGFDPSAALVAGVADDGTRLGALTVAPGANVALIGPPGRGKTGALEALCAAARAQGWRVVPAGPPWVARIVSPAGSVMLLADDADGLVEPMARGDAADAFRAALADPASSVVFAVSSARHVRYPDQCSVRFVFPTADKPSNVMAGVPSPFAAALSDADLRTPGRAVMLDGGARLVQFFHADDR